MSTELKLLKEKISEAELILLGIGEEWVVPDNITVKSGLLDGFDDAWIQENNISPFIKKILIDNQSVPEVKALKEGYQLLSELLQDKNYFVVSLCEDGLIRSVGLRDDRIVQPCGNMTKLQCPDGCEGTLFSVDELLNEWLQKLTNQTLNKEEFQNILNDFPAPKCPACGKVLTFNTLKAGTYLETGYLDEWSIYKKWLQGTVNKKVCIIELGVGMKYPTVIRWPFEKIAFFNQKASFFRVHSRLYQTAEEIKEKSFGIQMTTEEFIQELSSCD